MQQGSLVYYTGLISMFDLMTLLRAGKTEPKRQVEYEITAILPVEQNGRKMMFVQIDSYGDLCFHISLFSEAQGPGEIDIAELLKMPELQPI